MLGRVIATLPSLQNKRSVFGLRREFFFNTMTGEDIRHPIVAFVTGVLVDVVSRIVEYDFASIRRRKTARIVGCKLILNCTVASSGEALDIYFSRNFRTGGAPV